MRPLPNVKVSSTELQKLRIERGFTQDTLARALGEKLNRNVLASNLSHWENGTRYVPTKYIAALCDILECEIDDLIIKPVEAGQEDMYEIAGPLLTNFDQKPIYVHFDTYNHADGWALVNVRYPDIELVFTDVTLKVRVSSEGVSYYSREPIQNIPKSALGKCMNFKEMMSEYAVYVTMKTADKEVRALYNGWYRHNENQSALIKDDGTVLPYSGLGRSYSAHKQKNTVDLTD